MSKASSFWSQHSQPFGLWLPARSSSGNACTVQQSCGKHVPTLNTVGVKWLDAAKPMSKPGHQNHMASGISWHLHLLPKTRTFIFPCAPITSRFYIPEKPMNTSDWRLLHPSISPEPHKYIPITSPFFQWWPCLAKGQRHQASEAACGRLWQILAGCRVKIMGTVQYNGILTYTSYDIIDPYNHFSMELLASSGMGGKLLVSVNYQKPFKSCPSSTLVRKKLGWLTHIRTLTSDVPSPRSQSHWQSQNTWRICGYPKSINDGASANPTHVMWDPRKKKTCWSSWNLSYQNTVPVSRFNVSCGASGESTASTWNSQLHPLTRWCVECGSWGEWWMAIMGKTLALILKYKEIIFIRTTYERPTGECSSSSLIEDHGCWNMWAGFTTLWHPLMLAG